MAKTQTKRRSAKPAKSAGGGGAGGKPYWEMNTTELREATKEFDREFVFDKSKPLNAEQRRQAARARRRGRPRTGQGAKAISLSVEQGLLRRADQYAKGHGMSRAQLVARGLELAIAGARGEGK